MGKIYAQTEKEKKEKVILRIGVIAIVILFALMIIVNTITGKQNNIKLDYDSLKTIEDVLNYYECKYIYDKDSELEEFHIDIKTVFKYDLYTNDISNEDFFNNVINDIARITNYANFRMIDEEKDIDIKVVCQDYKIYAVYINDIENYFIFMNSQKDLEKYVEIEKIDFNIDSFEVQNLINNNWDSNINFGTRESIFEKYYEYFDEGIKTRTIDGKVYNIIFTNKYKGNVINGLFPGVDLTNVKLKLGTPQFEDDELNVIGYKGKQIYVFFTENEISIYRISNTESEEFFELADKLLNEDLDLLDFMNELTYLWPDYSDYDYNETSVFLSYPLKGIDVKIGYENTNAIILYNNITSNFANINKYLQNAEFISNLKIDNVFNAEKRRVEKEILLLSKCEEYLASLDKSELEIIGESLRYNTYAELDNNDRIYKLCFICKDGNNPNRELYDNVSSYIWIDSDNIMYSQTYFGIYKYNVNTGEKNIIVRGNESYNLKEFKNGVLKYDNTEIIIQY